MVYLHIFSRTQYIYSLVLYELHRDGQEWQRMRSVVDKPMMKIKTVESYADSFNIVAAEFLDRLASIRGPDGVVENIDVELFNWSLECK